MKRRSFLQAIGPIVFATKPTTGKEKIERKSFQVPVCENNSILDGSAFLYDYFPEAPTQGVCPDDWITTHDYEYFFVGMKRLVYDDTNKGWSTLIYKQYEWCCDILTVDMIQLMYDMKTKPGPIINVHFECVCAPIGPIKCGVYGWFWCGGVYPVEIINGIGKWKR